jgi:hypothetical protein
MFIMIEGSKDISHDHDHTDFVTQIPTKFQIWAMGAYLTFMTPKSIYFLDLYKISDRLMTYFIFEPPIAQPRHPVDFNFF